MRALFPDIPEAIGQHLEDRRDVRAGAGVRADAHPDGAGAGRPDVGRVPARSCAAKGSRRSTRRTPRSPCSGWSTSWTSCRRPASRTTSSACRTSAQHARQQGIQMALRGSAAASIILYCLGVTDIDPLEHRLVFERFLNIERKEMPDVDMDFAEDRRDEMIRYAAERYGHDRVAQIITFGTLGAKASIRDVGRALGMSYADVDRVARLVPVMPASFGTMTIERALKEGPDLKQLYEADPTIAEADRHGAGAGRRRAARQHARGGRGDRAGAAGEHHPAAAAVLRRRERAADDAVRDVGRGRAGPAEDGLPRPDEPDDPRHGLRRDQAVRSGVDIDLVHLPDNDPKTGEMLARGETFGVFQLESARDAALRAGPAAVVDQGPGGDGRAVPARADAAHPDVHPGRARRGGGEVPAPGPRRDPGRDVRGHRLPGPGAADRAEVRGVLAGRSGHHAQGDGQEDPLDHEGRGEEVPGRRDGQGLLARRTRRPSSS